MQKIWMIGLIFFMVGCNSTTTPVSQPVVEEPTNIETSAAATKIFIETNSAIKNSENKTATALAPTATKRPTSTPKPTRTPTNTPEPVETLLFSGQGDDVIKLNKWDGFAFLHITYSGARNFIVKNYDKDGNDIDLLVNTVGAYDGYLPLDLFDDEDTDRLEIKASGPWQVEVFPLEQDYFHTIEFPGEYYGIGDDVVMMEKSASFIVIFSAEGTRNFIVKAISDSGSDLLVNDIAPYAGASIVKKDTFMFVIKATGPWYMGIDE
jgi:hypothetical protein